ncbi:MAG: choice-of-anchor I family protein [Candidatus Kapabacteria bacterium]|nr:choice-of-anchor I family protein [Ignavibacteriota bacterium]MCW5884118.1 choice-of-anchor I family protein [Candidatus Kapabacteria bacterium]
MVIRRFLILSMMLLATSILSHSQVLVHYWNFNDPTNLATLTTPYSMLNGAGITHIPGGISQIDVAGGTGQNFNVDNLNARFGDASGNHLRFNDPIGGALVFSLPTTGFSDVVVKYATRRSGSGAGWQIVHYTTDGQNYIVLDTILPNNGNPTLITLDFSAIEAVNDNADFKIRFTFEQGPGGTVGNNRFDNFTLEGISEEGDIFPPVVTFAPVNNAIEIPVNVKPTITFNENIRLVNNAEINNSNAASVIIFKMNNANGSNVPFTATYSDKVLTVIPNQNLANSQTYYLALIANSIEDFSDNAIEDVQSIQFTTISLQTQFNKGDLIPVAYRMNSTGTPDEIALLTTVNILPGTKINITDAKYTDNAQSQCSGGIVWTAPQSGIPAGTVIQIQNDDNIANFGTVTGSSFGLSSSGDQVIVYTGTAQNPNYITALSSNAWIANNTTCGGSLSKIPAGLTDGINSINLSTAPDNVNGNTVNAFYNGPQNLPFNQLRPLILDPQNWVGTASGTPAQVWPSWAFPGPPTVVEVTVINYNTIRVVFNKDMNEASATNINNFTGVNGLAAITRSNNGNLRDTLWLNYSGSFQSGNNYTLTIQNVMDSEGQVMFTPYLFNFNYETKISFASNFLVFEEDDIFAKVVLKIENPSNASVNLVPKPAPFSTATVNSDFTFNTQTINITPTSNLELTFNIPIINDNIPEDDEYFVLSLENANGVTISGFNYATIYIRDNDTKIVAPKDELQLTYIGSFDADPATTSTTEIVAYDPISKRLFLTSAIENRFDISDFSNPSIIQKIKSINMTPYGGITSVAVNNGVVAVASPNADETLPGKVVFFDTDGNYLNHVTVGSLPDMVVFTNDGKKVLTANEGQPNNAYTIDPEGSVSIIDISGGIQNLTQNNVTTLDFTQFNANEAELIESGVRKLKKSSTLSQDLEPEYITISADNEKAWVTLQENNAIAEINLTNNSISSIWALGTRSAMITGNGFDASDNNNEILIANWPVKSFFIPDAVSSFSQNGTTFLVTANEGDEKEFSALNERTTVGNNNYRLDPNVFPNSDVLKQSYNLGRFRVSNLHGDADGDGFYEEIYSVGTRSFSIWNSDTKSLVWDSKNEFEQIIAKHPQYKSIFNADNGGSSTPKARSRAKGPEPEGVALARIGNEHYAFIGLERVGGVMAYNITNPNNPYFVDYHNSRIETNNGDLAPEGIIFINWDESPDGNNYVLVANEISGTVSVYQIITKPEINLNTVVACKNQAAELGNKIGNNIVSIINGSGDYSYTWSPSAGLINAGSGNPIVANPQYTTYYTLTAKDNVTGKTAQGMVKLEVSASPILNTPLIVRHPKNTVLDLSSITDGNISSGLAPYSVLWNDANGNIIEDIMIIPQIGTNQYFATAIDDNGCFSATKRVVVYVSPRKDATEEDIAFGVNGEIVLETYPNPVNDIMIANFGLSTSSAAKLIISDMTGAEILISNINSLADNFEINLSKLSSGVYFITVQTESDKVVKKFIKR